MNQAEQTADVLACWPRLADVANLPADPPGPVSILSRDQADGLVLAIGGDLILKRARAADRGPEGRFAQRLSAQERARKSLDGNLRGLKAPKLLALLPAEGIALVTRLPGATAAELLEQADSNRDRRAVLEDCGRWLAEFHRSGSGRDRPFQTRFALDQLAHLRDRTLSGAQRVTEPPFFLRLCEAVEATAPLFDGRPARQGEIHGDYRLGHVVIDPGSVGAIGFQPERTGPVGHDVARLLIDFAAHHAEHRKIPDGQILQGPYRAAFCQGYDFAPPDDASIRFLALVRLVVDWASVPPDEARLGLVHVVRLEGLRQTAMRMFPALRRA